MSSTVEQLVNRLRDSGLFSAEEMQRPVERCWGSGRFGDAAEMADALAPMGKLTTYQADVWVQGRRQPLVIDDYVMLDRVGRGGMGEVFKAQHRAMKRLVALKRPVVAHGFSPMGGSCIPRTDRQHWCSCLETMEPLNLAARMGGKA